MSTVNEKTGVITSDEGWTIKLNRNLLFVHDGVRKIELVIEILQGGVKLVIYDELTQKGYAKSDSDHILSVTKSALEGVGFSVEIE
jgi:hypothetical protein